MATLILAQFPQSGYPTETMSHYLNSHKLSPYALCLGFNSENLQFPTELIPKKSKVLDVGSGSGVISAQMRDKLKCIVTGLECGREKTYTGRCSIESSQSILGKENVVVSTLQAYANSHQCRKFPVVTVFRYNVPTNQKVKFCEALTRVVERNGVVIIHVVERERAFRDPSNLGLFLIDELRLNFNDVTITKRHYGYGPTSSNDILIQCRDPKASAHKLEVNTPETEPRLPQFLWTCLCSHRLFALLIKIIPLQK